MPLRAPHRPAPLLGVLAVAAACVLFAGPAQASAARTLIRVNQVGYAPGATKTALIMSSRRLTGRPFAVVGAARGAKVLAGRVGRARGSWGRWRYVQVVRFSSLKRSGRYRVRAAGAVSPVFSVAPSMSLYSALAGKAVGFLAGQRDGAALAPSPLPRRPSHLRDTSATTYAPPHYRGTTLTRPLQSTGGPVDVSGGWMDAGDSLKFVETGSFADVMTLLALRDHAASLPNRDAALAEARFETDWLARMWLSQPGVLLYQVGIGDGDERKLLGDHDLWRLPERDDNLRAKPGTGAWFVSRRPAFAANRPGQTISPNLAGRMAAALALAAQVFADSDPQSARRWLLAGQQIYARADTRPRGALLTASPSEYYSDPEWRDDMELGAIELYQATHKLGGAGMPQPDADQYLNPAGRFADAYMRSSQAGHDSLNGFDVAALAHYDLVRVLRSPDGIAAQQTGENIDVRTGPGALQRDMRSQLALAGKRGARDPFGLANLSGNVDTVPHALGVALEARMYDELVGRPAYEAMARQQVDWVLGANAWGSSFVVGAGSTFPHCLAHQVANLEGSLDGRGALLTGATVDGPNEPASVTGLGAPDGYRRCPARGADPFKRFDARGFAYRDDVRSSSTSEPSIDYTSLALAAFAQAAGRP